MNLNMVLVRLICVVNTENLSLELIRWIDAESQKTLSSEEKKFMQNSDKLFTLLTETDYPIYEKRMIGVGEVNRVNKEEVDINLDLWDYILYEGECKDKEKLSYFIPKRVVKKGTLDIKDVKKINKIQLK